MVTISDKKIGHDAGNGTIDYYLADVITANDYYPFGMMMPGRKYEQTPGKPYRYSINGQEKELELNENITTAEYWEYDSRIARRWNVDPVPDETQSPYAVFDNNPIAVTDVDGDCTDCPDDPIESTYLGWTGLDFGSFGNGVADGFIGALPDLVGFVGDLIVSGEARDNFAAGLKTFFNDVPGAIKALAADKYELWSSVLSGNGTEQQKYDVGKEAGNLIFGALSGAALSKLTEVIKVAKYEKQLVKIIEKADEAVGSGKPNVRGTKIHTKLEQGVNKTSKAKRAEVSYKDGKVRRRGAEGTSRADAIYGKNQAKPKIAYDLKTGKSGISKADAAKYRKNLPKGTKLKEISKDANGKYKVKKAF